MPSITSALALNPSDLVLDPAKGLVSAKSGVTMREMTEHTAATTGQIVDPKDVGEKFEAMYLRQMLDEMMPKDSDELFGDHTAGPMWRSMMVDSLATALSKTTSIGIAQMIAKAHPADIKEKP